MEKEANNMICTIQEISKMLGGNIIFENLSLSIKTGDRLGVVGRNGAGKTTLFKLIARIESPDKGSIHFKKGTKIGYLAQIPSFSADITGYDVLNSAFQSLNEIQIKLKDLEVRLSNANPEEMEKLLQSYGDAQEAFTNLGGYQMESEIEKVIQGLQLSGFVYQSFSSLSGGEQTKIMLGKLLLNKTRFIVTRRTDESFRFICSGVARGIFSCLCRNGCDYFA